MRLVIDGRGLPGEQFAEHRNVHLGIQRGRDSEQLVSAGGKRAKFEAELDVVPVEGGFDYRGPYVQGKRGDRFVYLTWVDVDERGEPTMFRRLKLMLGAIDRGTVEAAQSAGALTARLTLSDAQGGPLCAAVRPPLVEWSAGT